MVLLFVQMNAQDKVELVFDDVQGNLIVPLVLAILLEILLYKIGECT
jgi:hypothetical protein